MKHELRTPERPQQKWPIEFAGTFAVAVEHCQIVIATEKNGQLNQGEKLLLNMHLSEKAVTSEREGKLWRPPKN